MTLFVFCPKRRRRHLNVFVKVNDNELLFFIIHTYDLFISFFLFSSRWYVQLVNIIIVLSEMCVCVCFLLLLKTYQMLCSIDYAAKNEWLSQPQLEELREWRRKKIAIWKKIGISSDVERNNDNDIMVLSHAIISNWAESWIGFRCFFFCLCSSPVSKCIWSGCSVVYFLVALYHSVVERFPGKTENDIIVKKIISASAEPNWW